MSTKKKVYLTFPVDPTNNPTETLGKFLLPVDENGDLQLLPVYVVNPSSGKPTSAISLGNVTVINPIDVAGNILVDLAPSGTYDDGDGNLKVDIEEIVGHNANITGNGLDVVIQDNATQVENLLNGTTPVDVDLNPGDHWLTDITLIPLSPVLAAGADTVNILGSVIGAAGVTFSTAAGVTSAPIYIHFSGRGIKFNGTISMVLNAALTTGNVSVSMSFLNF